MTEQPITPNGANGANDGVVDPYAEVAFETFLKEIGNVNLPNWTILAEALGVHRNTINRWKKHPQAQAAISAAIEQNIREMELAGKGDWRMYREKLKMLGVKEAVTLEHEAGESVKSILDKLEHTDYDKLGQTARGQMVAANPPIQDKG